MNYFKIKLLKAIFIVLVCVGFSFKSGIDNSSRLSVIRLGFYDAIMDCKKAESLIVAINEVTTQSSLVKVYKGATYAIMAKNQWNPFTALRLLRISRGEMNRAVEAAPKNLEIRFVRFAVQKNIPSYLGYSDNMEGDKEYLIKHIDRFYNPKLSKKMRDYILSFMVEQGGYDKQQIKLIKEKLSD